MQAMSVVKPMEGQSEAMRSQEAATVHSLNQQKSDIQKSQEQYKEDALGLTNEQLHDITGKMNDVAAVFNTSLIFSVDDNTGRTIITVKDKETDKIIRQIPPENMLKLMHNMKDVMGMLLDVEI